MEPNNHRRHPPERPLHPLPDPTSSPLHTISQRFSKLYANHTKLGFNSKHAANSLSHHDAELHHYTSKPSTILRKSRSQHETRSSIATPNPQFFSSKVKHAPKIDSKKGSHFPKLIPKEDEVKEVRRVSVSSFPSPSMLTGGGGRLSFGNSQFELAYFFSSSGCKILAVDMPPFMQIQAADSARRAHDSLEKFTSKTMALTIKKVREMEAVPLVNEPSFTETANPSSYLLNGMLSIPVTGGELGLRMGNLSAASGGVEESTLTEYSAGSCVNGGGERRICTLNSYDDGSSKFVSNSSSANDIWYEHKLFVAVSRYGGGATKGPQNLEAVNKKSIPDPTRDYIHVRARRGQATDSHSLDERARREKISERMKILQNLVPGCNKIVGKALVLDEIINYIQTLQYQVEFLSMKLEALSSRFPSRDPASQMLGGHEMG